MTSVQPSDRVVVTDGVYAPQHDSWLLCDVMRQTRLVAGRKVADLCTGSGVLAIAAARLGARSVTAFDVSRDAVSCAVANALSVDAEVDVHLADCQSSSAYGPFDVVVSNPPYVPTPSEGDHEVIPLRAGPARAYDAGEDGRAVLDPMCAAAPKLLSDKGTLLLVHSELSGVGASLQTLREGGLKAAVIARRWIPFGPVLSARAAWLERTGRIPAGRRTEQLVVIRADVP